MHPRESAEDYFPYSSNYDFVRIESNLSVMECFNTCSLFLSNLSTVIIEGLTIGIPVYSLMIHFDYWKYKKSFLGEDCIRKIYDKQSLYTLLREKNTVSADLTLIQRSRYFCNMQTSVEPICQEIIK